MRKTLKSFGYALQGLRYAFSTQLNFKIHAVAASLATILGIYCTLSTSEWLWLTVAIGLVIILELINTAIEILVDLVSPSQNPKAGAIKDVAAAAVLIGALTALTIGLIIFVPKFI